MYHWQDAYEYRQSGGVIEDAKTLKAYTEYQRTAAENDLKASGFDTTDLHKTKAILGQYAHDMQRKNNFEEVYTEFRTKQLIEGR